MKGDLNNMRRKLPEGMKKVTLNLTVNQEIKAAAVELSDFTGLSISEMVSQFVVKEYKKMLRAAKKESGGTTRT